MAELSTLARPYARAAFEYARDNGELDGWAQQLSLAATVAADSTVALVLSDPALTDEQQAASLCDVCGDSLAAAMRNFIAILAGNKRLALLPEISDQFAQLKASQEKSVDVAVVSAFDLSEATREQLTSVLSRKLERDVRVQVSTDRNLLGGVVIRAGDMVIDGSVRGRLNKLAEAMNS